MNRDARIDVWRGLCLVDVVLVHLAYNGLGFPGLLDDLIKHYLRFAAGGFVFIAGLTVAVVFGPKVAGSATERRIAYGKLWRRAALLIVVDVCASSAYRLLDAACRFPLDPDTPLSEALLATVSLQRPGLTGGILLLYSVLLAITPLVFALQRRAGAWPLGLLSGGAYGVALGTGGVLNWPPYDFPVLYWQPLYFAGFLSVRWYHRIATARTLHVLLWATAASAAFAVVFLAHHGRALGWPYVAQVMPLDFTKTPLQLGGLLWYLTLVQAVLAWATVTWNLAIAGARTAQWLALLGRHSLLVYTAHVFTELLVIEYVWTLWPPVIIRLCLVAMDVLVLSLLCVLVETPLRTKVSAWLSTLPRPVVAYVRPAAAALATAMLVVLAVSRPVGESDGDGRTERLEVWLPVTDAAFGTAPTHREMEIVPAGAPPPDSAPFEDFGGDPANELAPTPSQPA